MPRSRAESYAFPHFALFSTELLRDYFRRHAIGVYARGPAEGDRARLAFRERDHAGRGPQPDELAAPRPGRLLFYARPEEHAARNMFELGVLALSQALEDGALGTAGSCTGSAPSAGGGGSPLGAGVPLELMPRADQGATLELLREHDVGLALMYTPHPSLVPIEMASAGMLTVTNSSRTRRPRRWPRSRRTCRRSSPRSRGSPPGSARRRAGSATTSAAPRAAAVNWSRDWYDSFDDS